MYGKPFNSNDFVAQFDPKVGAMMNRELLREGFDLVTGGVRIGTAAVTTRGLGEEEMHRIAHCIALTARDFEGTSQEVRATVADICEKHPLYK